MQLAINIVVLASLYALLSSGYVLIYRVSRVLNLAHGELMMLAAFLLFSVATGVSTTPVVAIAVTLVLSVVIGIVLYVGLMRKMTGNSVLAAVLTTISLGIVLRGIIILVWTSQQRQVLPMLGISNPVIEIGGGGRISALSLALVGANAVVYIALFGFLQFTKWGIRMRAAGQNPLLAAQRGVSLHAVNALAWGLSTAAGAICGILVALDSGLQITMATIGLKAFPAALVGGLDSLAGALVGAFVVAAAEVILIQKVDPLLSDVVPFFVLIGMLALRPWGLFGTREELDRV